MNSPKTIRILVAEDDYLVSEEVIRILKKLGCEVVGVAPSGDKAIEMTHSLRPDIILMDIKLPKIDGLTAAREIQKSCPTPVIVLSAYESRDLLEKVSEIGIYAYLTKPVESAEIERAIAIVLARHSDLMKMCRINADLQKEITMREKAEMELENAKVQAENTSEAKSQFLANLSHDLRTPLNAIIGFNRLLRETLLGGQQKDYADTVQTSAENLLSLIEDILDISKIEAKEIQLRNIEFDLYNLVEETGRIARLELQDKNIELNHHINRDVPKYFFGDPIRIKQIFSNLLGNAVRYTNKGSIDIYIEFKAIPPEKMQTVNVCIKDTGTGISKDNLDFIFEPFTRFVKPNIAHEGVGLGLHIVMTLVRLMGGKIGVTSEEGKGSKFIFALKLKPVGEIKQDQILSQASKDLALEGVNVLVVEDDEPSRDLVSIVLKGYGCVVDLATNGEDALEKIKNGPYDIILMDIRLPGEMNGYKITELIRKDMHKRIPIIALTAHAMEWVESRCLKAGMNGYLTKPFDQNKLKEVIVKWAKKK